MTMQAMTGKTEGRHSTLDEVLAMETGAQATVHGFFQKEKPPRTDSFCSGRDRVYAYPAVPPKLLPAAITRQPLSSLTRINRMRLGDCVGAPARECSFRPWGFCAWLSAGGHASLVENAGYSSLSLPFLLWMDGIIAHPHEAVKRFLSISFQNQLNSISL